MNRTIPLEQLDRSQTAEVGAKAATLGELLQLGLPVPPGFVIPPGVSGPELAEAVRVVSAGLGPGPYAVRSSAVGRNGADFGRHDSFLGIDVDEVYEHVLRCRASLRRGPADAGRRQPDLDGADTRVGVLVQRLVDARAAGVAFTIDPSDGDRSKVVIEASWGLGTAVVLGEVVPDRWTVDKELGEVQGPGRSHKTVEWLRVGDGVRPLSVDSGRWKVACLAPDEVRELATLAVRVEDLLGAPQVIEWALDGSGLHLLQSRPVRPPGPRGANTP